MGTHYIDIDITSIIAVYLLPGLSASGCWERGKNILKSVDILSNFKENLDFKGDFKMERAEALRLGVKKYTTGRACRHGHNVERYTKSGSCSACVKNLVTISSSNSAAVRARIEAVTKKIYLFSQESGYPAIKAVIDGYLMARYPDLHVDVVNPYPFVGKQVSMLTYQIQVRVPLEDVENAYRMGKLLLEPEICKPT